MNSTFSTPLTPTELQSRTIDFLRFPLTVFVVFIHSLGTPPLAYPDYANFGATDFFNLIRIVGSNVLTHTAVPSFFLISGFLYFLHLKEWNISVYRQKTRRRIQTLIIPYLLWNVISLMVRLGGCLLGKWIPGMGDTTFLDVCTPLNWLWNIEQWGFNNTSWIGEQVLRSGPLNVPLWFLRDLICISLLSPVVYYYVRFTRHWGVILLALCYASHIFPNWTGLGITSVFYFTLGAYFSIEGKNMIEWMQRYSKRLSICALVLFPIVVYYNGGNTKEGAILMPFFIISMLPLLFSWGAKCAMRGVQMPQLLSSCSFFIYALHSVVVLRLCIKISETILPWDTAWIHLLRYFLVPVLIVACCILVYAVLKKVCPRFLHLLTGR